VIVDAGPHLDIGWTSRGTLQFKNEKSYLGEKMVSTHQKTGTGQGHVAIWIENDRTSAVPIMQASRHSKFAEFVCRPGLLLALCLYAAFLNLPFFDTLRHSMR
jgi:hypothetical protein